MFLRSLERAIYVANTVDHDRLAADPAYRQRVVNMLGCDEPKDPSPSGRLATFISRVFPKAA